jgi:hypothetical protein
MIKLLIRVSYWLGVACVVLAVLSKGLNALGIEFAQFTTRGNEIGYRSFLLGAFLFFLMAIATASFDSFNKHNP